MAHQPTVRHYYVVYIGLAGLSPPLFFIFLLHSTSSSPPLHLLHHTPLLLSGCLLSGDLLLFGDLLPLLSGDLLLLSGDLPFLSGDVGELLSGDLLLLPPLLSSPHVSPTLR